MNENIPKKRMMRKLIFESLFQLSIKDVKLDNILFTFEKLNEQAHLEESYYLEAKQYIEDIYKNKNEV